MIGGRGLALLITVAAVGCGGSDHDEPGGTILLFDTEGMSAISVESRRTRLIRLQPEPWGAGAYSPDGKRIAYEGEAGLYVADADGSNARRIPGQPSVRELSNVEPSWSPDGDRIVFERDGSLYTISPEGEDPEFLVRGSAPRWADGRIAFTSGYDENHEYADIVVMHADGTGRKVLAHGDSVDLSPEGSMLAYSAPGGTDPAASNRAVYVRPVDGGKPRRVTDNGYAPIWSPDGDYLAFTRITECGHAVCSGRIFVMPVEGGDAVPVSKLIGDPSGALDWIE
jgi:Tol biopolymer transport system component